ncbi:MAG: hypothetical protein ABIA47_00285 [bacterium]
MIEILINLTSCVLEERARRCRDASRRTCGFVEDWARARSSLPSGSKRSGR